MLIAQIKSCYLKKSAAPSDSINNVIVKLIIEKPNSYAAVDFFKYHKSKFSNEELSSLYNKLDEELKESREGKAIKLQSEFTKPEVGDKYYDYQAINQNGNTSGVLRFQRLNTFFYTFRLRLVITVNYRYLKQKNYVKAEEIVGFFGNCVNFIDKTFQNVPLLPVLDQAAVPIESVPMIGV